MPPTNLLQGTLDLLILRVLSLEEMHGLGISRRIGQVTRGAFEVKPGSLFPALHRMEEAGWLASKWGESGAAWGQVSRQFHFRRPNLTER